MCLDELGESGLANELARFRQRLWWLHFLGDVVKERLIDHIARRNDSAATYQSHSQCWSWVTRYATLHVRYLVFADNWQYSSIEMVEYQYSSRINYQRWRQRQSQRTDWSKEVSIVLGRARLLRSIAVHFNSWLQPMPITTRNCPDSQQRNPCHNLLSPPASIDAAHYVKNLLAFERLGRRSTGVAVYHRN